MSSVKTTTPIMSQAEYSAHHGTQCPFCRSTQTEGGEVEIDMGTARQKVSCNDCDGEWTDHYTLLSYTPIV